MFHNERRHLVACPASLQKIRLIRGVKSVGKFSFPSTSPLCELAGTGPWVNPPSHSLDT